VSRPTIFFIFRVFVELRVGRGTRPTSAEQIFDLRFRVFRVMAGWMRSRRPQLSKALPCGDTTSKKNPLHETDGHPKIHTVILIRFIT